MLIKNIYPKLERFDSTYRLFTLLKRVVVNFKGFSDSKIQMQVKMASEKVRVNAAMNPPILLVDYSHRARLNGTAVVRVQAPSSMKSNGSIDIVTLLDVSHSISWMASSSEETPSKMDLLKNALKFIISQLDDNDRLAIVAFNDQVIKEHTTGILEISGGGRMAIEKKVDGLVTQGDTAFKPSLEHAVKVCSELSYSI